MPALADRVRTVMTADGKLVRRSGDVRVTSWDGRTWQPEYLQDGGWHAFPAAGGDELAGEGRRVLRHLRPAGRV
ncbi:MAG: hypothetical protein U0871_12005 [Gemmataceae bacterium]